MKNSTWLAVVFGVAVMIQFSEAQPLQTRVTLIESNKTAAAFSKGMPLFETGEFKVHASRRESPGVAEIHTKDTDIIHVLEGSATLVTGGATVDPKTIASGEIRGREIQGGESCRIAKGDVIIIPNGVAHWFKQVDAPLLYYVVKVTSTHEAK